MNRYANGSDKQGGGVLHAAERAGIAIGRMVNVLFTCPDSEPMLRELTSVDVKHERGKDWLIWKWNARGSTPHGTADCGFGGNVIDDEFLALLEKLP